MTITVKYIQNVAIMSPIGKLTSGAGHHVLMKKVYELIGERQKKIVANLSQISDIDDIGIVELVSAFTEVRNQGGKFKICEIPTELYKSSQNINTLYNFIEIYVTEQEAIDSF